MTLDEARKILNANPLNNRGSLVVLDVADGDTVKLTVGWVHGDEVFKGQIVLQNVEAVSLADIPITPTHVTLR